MTKSSAKDALRVRLPGKTVFILGSGFSAPLGIPVIAEFIPKGLNLLKASAWPNREVQKSETQIRKDRELITSMSILLDRYSEPIAQLDGGTANLEDLFCLVDLFGGLDEANNPDRRILRQFIVRVCAIAWERHERAESEACRSGQPRQAEHTPAVQMKHYFRDRYAPRSSNHGPWADGNGSICLYEAFLSQVLYGQRAALCAPELKDTPDYSENAVISLNYDLIIERKMTRFFGVRIFYGQGVLAANCEHDIKIARSRNQLGRDRCLPLIKLHGSLNWKDPNPESDAPIAKCEKDEIDGDATPLILPTWQRRAVGRERSAALLREARSHLQLASRLVFIGYSMPATDRYLRYLFTEALAIPELPEIAICNLRWSENEARRRCRDMLGYRIADEHIRVYPGLVEYVSASKSESSLG